MDLPGVLSTLYNRAVREPLTGLLESSAVSMNRSELRRMCDRSMSFGEASTFQPPPPAGPDPVPPPLEKMNRVLEVPGPFVCELPRTQLVGPDLLAISADNRYVVEETVAKPDMLTDALARTLYSRTLPVRRKTTQKFDRPVASLGGIQSQAYFHWFGDYLPRVRGLEKYAEETGTYPDVLVAPDPPEWMRLSRQHVGVPDERVIEWTGGRATADPLVVPTIPRTVFDESPLDQYVYSPEALRWVGDRIRSSVGAEPGDEHRILITRRSATTRRLVNEREVVDALSPLGFEAVNLSETPFEEQVALFAGAEAVVAPHGAGLINTIYAEDVKVLELFGDFVTPLYYCVATGLGFPYRYELCDHVEATEGSRGVPLPGNDLLVDVERLERVLREWLGS